MRKETTICFRTSKDLRKRLEKIARRERRTLSTVIQNALLEAVNRPSTLGEGTERRLCPRKKVSLPAFLSVKRSETSCPAIIDDISLNGLKLFLEKDCALDIHCDDPVTYVGVLFALPQQKSPVVLTCMPNRVRPVGGEIEVGASFADCNFSAYQKVQYYLLQ